ncbi:Sulfotransferase family protein [Pseudoruegeria aquimaris]|uniref:Sulfotransferase family protein n=1 Tax=Pseudoruegeria aquimaris TaxID=393663 RepID=A0A1Y5TGW1_9RHOB|nr:sulfotransferase family 2 domain-containing protein [Pseudoruegeria aquimaris]SLN63490.1 Sulfotransferase family protein [Pseudoruegeria aquimaris]
MILSRGRNLLFIHIPKTGGTSLALALEARAMKDDILVGDTPKAVKRRKRQKELKTAGRLWKHSTLADLDGLVTGPELDRLFVTTLVRNPWDRAVSYYHWLQAQRFDHPAVRLAAALSFSDFLNHPQTRAALLGTPYAHYVTDARGRETCSKFMRLEHLDEDLPALEDHLGFSLRPLPRANPSSRRGDYRSYYSDADAALVAKLCAEDITRFGYRFT